VLDRARVAADAPRLAKHERVLTHPHLLSRRPRPDSIPIGRTYKTEGLDTLTILSDEIVAVVAASHPWATRR